MSETFSFEYGPAIIQVYRPSAGAAWRYRVGSDEFAGPPAHVDDRMMVREIVRRDIRDRGSPLEPGSGLYQFRAGLVALQPTGPTYWLNEGRDNRCFRGHPEGGRAVRLYPPAGAGRDSKSVLVDPAHLWRADTQDCPPNKGALAEDPEV